MKKYRLYINFFNFLKGKMEINYIFYEKSKSKVEVII